MLRNKDSIDHDAIHGQGKGFFINATTGEVTDIKVSNNYWVLHEQLACDYHELCGVLPNGDSLLVDENGIQDKQLFMWQFSAPAHPSSTWPPVLTLFGDAILSRHNDEGNTIDCLTTKEELQAMVKPIPLDIRDLDKERGEYADTYRFTAAAVK